MAFFVTILITSFKNNSFFLFALKLIDLLSVAVHLTKITKGIILTYLKYCARLYLSINYNLNICNFTHQYYYILLSSFSYTNMFKTVCAHVLVHLVPNFHRNILTLSFLSSNSFINLFYMSSVPLIPVSFLLSSVSALRLFLLLVSIGN